ncbi:shikimate kinase, partial [Gammaproteobacteria bacterium]|nr:shikimate kinase [Gammaproteobacteria bacterium]
MKLSKIKNHIILIGFKSVGKTTVGKLLSNKLNIPHIDLDNKIEIFYEQKCNNKLSCREIMSDHGEDYFRSIEHNTLFNILNYGSSVISLGGGAPLNLKSQKLLKPYITIYLISPKLKVFKRILDGGKPGFLINNQDMNIQLNQIWRKRNNVYKSIKTFIVKNNFSIDNT